MFLFESETVSNQSVEIGLFDKRVYVRQLKSRLNFLVDVAGAARRVHAVSEKVWYVCRT